MVDAVVDSAAACPSVRFKRDMYKTRDFSPMSTAAVMDKDLDIALDIARKNNLAVPLAAIARQMYSSMGSTGRFNTRQWAPPADSTLITLQSSCKMRT